MTATQATQIGCLHCIHMATHAACRGCLSDAGKTVHPDGSVKYNFNYAHFEPGTIAQAMGQLHAEQADGFRNIVIGHEGEAEINARWSPREAARILHRVACACGYLIEAPRISGDTTTIKAELRHGSFNLVWERGEFTRIEQVKPDGTTIVSWSR